MIVPEVRDTILELQKFGLGSRCPSPEVSKILLTEMRVPLKAHWNKDDSQWEIYRIKDKMLIWQMSLPKSMTNIDSGIKFYLEKFDSSKHGTRGDAGRQKDFKFWFDHIRPGKEEKKDASLLAETSYRYRDITDYLNRKFEGNKPCVVPAGPIVGHRMKDGRQVPIRIVKK